MRPEEPLLPEDSPEQPSRSASLDPSEEEALLRHLGRYQARKVRRRQGHKPLLAAGTVVAGAAVILVVVGLARSPRPEAPPSLATPVDETEAVAGRTVSPPPGRAEKAIASTDPAASRATPSGRETAATTPAPARPDRAAPEASRSTPAPVTPPAPTTPPAAPRPPTATAPAPTSTAATSLTAAPTAPPVAPGVSTSSPATPPSPGPPATAPAAPSSPPAPGIAVVAYQSRDRLALVSRGDTKDKVFDRFGTTFEQRGGSVVRIDGMRLRASGRSPRHAQVEVAEVTLADAAGGRVHWFLFGDGRLIAWGRPEEWPGAVQSHAIEIDYPPAARSGR